MRRLFPAPILSAVLFAVWLMLNGTLAPGQILLGLALATVLPWLTERLRPHRSRLRSFGVALKLALVVLGDILVANIDVARRVLGPESALRSRYVWLSLDIRDPSGIAVLAGIVSLTPGTVSADLAPDHRHLLIHVLHTEDEAALIAAIKQRYESPLMELFQ
jgi:multicomponent K+:H+ antiporter subunit E